MAAEWASQSFAIKEGDEDIHTANERRLGELIGPAAGKLHTGRSRNDQVALDTRLWLAGQMRLLRAHLRQLLAVAVERAEREVDFVMPGFTHLQPAQTVRWAHWVLCHASAWQRDDMRLAQIISRVETLPLGSGALAGNPFGVDRQALAADLGCSGGVCPNSMDAVSDRDFVAELQFWGALHMVHTSRFAEDLIIYSSLQFGYVAMSDAYSTGSSLMPQKKNPDALELLRGKSGRLLGNLAGTMAVLKGTPTTYNKDFQASGAQWVLRAAGPRCCDAALLLPCADAHAATYGCLPATGVSLRSRASHPRGVLPLSPLPRRVRRVRVSAGGVGAHV